jgi:hypothetical protein
MALGFQYNSGGDFLSSWRLNTISGDCVIVSSEKNASGDYEKKEVEVKFPAKFAMDFANLEVGWLAFKPTGPSFHLVKIGERMPAKPDDEHKQGFRLKLWSKQYGLSAFSATSRTISEALDVLHDQYLRGEKEHAGKVPVIEITGTEKVQVKTQQGLKAFKKPVWSISSWIDRPAELSEAAPVAEPAHAADTSDDF